MAADGKVDHGRPARPSSAAAYAPALPYSCGSYSGRRREDMWKLKVLGRSFCMARARGATAAAARAMRQVDDRLRGGGGGGGRLP